MYYISKYNYYLKVAEKYYIYNTISNRYKEFPCPIVKILQISDGAATDIKDENIKSILPDSINVSSG